MTVFSEPRKSKSHITVTVTVASGGDTGKEMSLLNRPGVPLLDAVVGLLAKLIGEQHHLAFLFYTNMLIPQDRRCFFFGKTSVSFAKRDNGKRCIRLVRTKKEKNK